LERARERSDRVQQVEAKVIEAKVLEPEAKSIKRRV
jgi:hypothetical protein